MGKRLESPPSLGTETIGPRRSFYSPRAGARYDLRATCLLVPMTKTFGPEHGGSVVTGYNRYRAGNR